MKLYKYYVNIMNNKKTTRGDLKMGFNHKITVKNFEVIEVCFRSFQKDNVFVNIGKIIIDSDTYNFAGFLTQDEIVGYFKEDHYEIYYTSVSHKVNINPNTHRVEKGVYPIERKKMESYVEFVKTGDLQNDFLTTFLMGNCVLNFKKIIREDDVKEKVLKYNSSLVKLVE